MVDDSSTSSISVLHVITSLDVGGAELSLKKLVLSDQSANRHTVIGLLDLGKIGHELRAHGITVQTLSMGRSSLNVTAFYRLVKMIRELKPDVIQTWMYHADFLAGIAARFAKRREIMWGIRQTGFAAGQSTRTYLLMKVCALLSHLIPRAIVCCAESAKKSHIKWGYRADIMTVIPNGFEPLPLNDLEARRVIRKSLGVREDWLLVGMVGRFDPLKNHFGFLQAASVVNRKFENARFMLVGRQMEWENLQLKRWIVDAGLSDKVLLLGERRDVFACLAAMDVFCLASLMEAFPNALAEAMATGLPCITTDVGDAVRIMGASGWVSRSTNPKDIADALITCLSVDQIVRSRMGSEARSRIATLFSTEATRDRYLSLYREMRSSK